jgi:hypothetical protein
MIQYEIGGETMSKQDTLHPEIKHFIEYVTNHFSFLETDYSYQRIDDYYELKEHYRDKSYIIRYLKKKMLVEISYYFAGAAIYVVFVETRQDPFHAKRSIFPTDDPSINRMIDVSTLSQFLDKGEEFIIIKDTHVTNVEEVKKRYPTLNDQLEDVVAGLAKWTKTYAIDILQGDTSIFDDVMEYYRTLINKQYPFDIY